MPFKQERTYNKYKGREPLEQNKQTYWSRLSRSLKLNKSKNDWSPTPGNPASCLRQSNLIRRKGKALSAFFLIGKSAWKIKNVKI
jgi:hypothetical protein